MELEFPSVLEIASRNFEVEIIFAKKRSSSVSVKGKKLVFRLSSYLGKRQAYDHFSDLSSKIAKKIEKSPSSYFTKSFDEVLESGEFIFGNKRYVLEYTNKGRGVKLNGNVFIVHINTKKENVERGILRILCKENYERLRTYLHVLNRQTYNYNIKDFQLKLVESKWGHCSHDNIIMLNLKLLNADIDILNYIIIHELSHIKHKNHSSRFWNNVERFCPNYKELRKKLKNEPPGLYI